MYLFNVVSLNENRHFTSNDLAIALQVFIGNPSQSYGASPAVWDHSVICHPTQVHEHIPP